MQDDSDKMLAFELGQIARGGPLAFNKATILEAIDRLAALLAERDEIEAMNQQQALRLMEQESARIAADAKLDAVTKERDALHSALNPQQWTSAMSVAWHLNIPDLQKAFDELTNAALTDQGRAGEEL